MKWLANFLAFGSFVSIDLVYSVVAQEPDNLDPQSFEISHSNARPDDVIRSFDALRGRVLFMKNITSGEFGIFVGSINSEHAQIGFLLIPTIARGETTSDYSYRVETYAREATFDWIYKSSPHTIFWHESAEANQNLIDDLVSPSGPYTDLLHGYNLESRAEEAIRKNKVSRSESDMSVGRYSLLATPILATAAIVAANWAQAFSSLSQPKPHYALLSFLALRMWPRSAAKLDRWSALLARPLQRNRLFSMPENTNRSIGYSVKIGLHTATSIGCAYLIAQLLK